MDAKVSHRRGHQMGDKIFEIKDSVRHQKKSYNGPKVVPTRESELR